MNICAISTESRASTAANERGGDVMVDVERAEERYLYMASLGVLGEPGCCNEEYLEEMERCEGDRYPEWYPD